MKYTTSVKRSVLFMAIYVVVAGVEAKEAEKPAPAKPAPAQKAAPSASGGAHAPGGASPAPTLSNIFGLLGHHPAGNGRAPSPPAPPQAPHPNATPPQQVTNHALPKQAPVSTRLLQCRSAQQAAGQCAVWGAFNSSKDRSILDQTRAYALQSGTYRSQWVGADGIQRQLTMNATPPTMMMVTLTAAAAVPAVAIAGSRGTPAQGGSSSSGVSGGYSTPTQTPQPDATSSSQPESTVLAESAPGASATDSAPESGATANAGVDTVGAAAPNAVSSVASVAAPTQRLCRRVSTIASVGSQSDVTNELWCRNDQGNWAEATDVTGAG